MIKTDLPGSVAKEIFKRVGRWWVRISSEQKIFSYRNSKKKSTDSNYKLKAIIAKSLGLSNINSPNIDFIVECLFNSAKSNSSLIRQNSLFAIRVLAEKAEEKVTYLKRKNLIPFYYEIMTDREQSIQAV